MELVVFQFVTIAFCSSTGDHRRVWLCFLYTHCIRYTYLLLRIPSDPSLPKGKQSQHSASPTMSDAPICHFCGTSLEWVQYVHVSTEEPSTGPSTSDVASPGLSGAEESPPLTTGHALPYAATDAVGCYCCKSTLLAHVHLVVHQDTQVCYLMSTSVLMTSSSCSFLQLPRFDGLNFSLRHR